MRPSTSPTIATSTSSWKSSSYPEPTRCTRFMVTPRTSRAICARKACGRRRSRLRNSWRWRYEAYRQNAPLAQCPAGAQDGAPQVRVAGGRIAEPREQQIQPRRQQNTRMQLHLFFVPPCAERAAGHLDDHLDDGAAVQVAALGFGDRDPLGQIVEQLDGFIVLVQRCVAEHARAIQRHLPPTPDLAPHTPPSLTPAQCAQSVYPVMA